MKKNKINRPISEKSYQKFVKQIKMVVRDHYLSLLMIKTLDRYLSGDRHNYYFGLDKEYRKVFEMLRFEIDAALERSARAKARAQQRREAAAKVEANDTSENKTLETKTFASKKSDKATKASGSESFALEGIGYVAKTDRAKSVEGTESTAKTVGAESNTSIEHDVEKVMSEDYGKSYVYMKAT